MSNQNNSPYSAHGTIIRDLCLARDNHYQSPHLLSYTEIIMLIACVCCYFPFLMYITFLLFFCGELHYNFILQIIFPGFVSYCIIFNLIVYALYEYFHQANKDYYYYY